MTKEEIFKEWEKLTTHEKNELNDMQLAYFSRKLTTIREDANEETKPLIDTTINFTKMIINSFKGNHNEKDVERKN